MNRSFEQVIDINQNMTIERSIVLQSLNRNGMKRKRKILITFVVSLKKKVIRYSCSSFRSSIRERKKERKEMLGFSITTTS